MGLRRRLTRYTTVNRAAANCSCLYGSDAKVTMRRRMTKKDALIARFVLYDQIETCASGASYNSRALMNYILHLTNSCFKKHKKKYRILPHSRKKKKKKKNSPPHQKKKKKKKKKKKS